VGGATLHPVGGATLHPVGSATLLCSPSLLGSASRSQQTETMLQGSLERSQQGRQPLLGCDPRSQQVVGGTTLCLVDSPPVGSTTFLCSETIKADTELPLCGFHSSGPSPFHFGGTPPTQTTHSTVPLFPQQTQVVGGGLPALSTPDVYAARARWLQQIDKLSAASGADKPLLARVRSMISEGAKSAFKTGPPPREQHANTYTFQKHEAACLERMSVYKDMRSMRRVAGTPPPGAHVQPLHAVVKEGKSVRVCFDLARNFNDFLEDEPFQMASVQDAVDLAMQAGKHAWFAKLDISSCFLSFPIHPDDLKFFYCQAGGDFYQFLALVFGRKDAPRVVSLLLDVVSSAVTDAGVPHVRYLDDFCLVATTALRAWGCAHTAAAILVEFGLALSLPKFEGPLQRIEFLGIIVDSIKETQEISEERKRELLSLLQAFGKRKTSSVKRLQSLLGKLAFAATVLPMAKPFLRRVIDAIGGRKFGTRPLEVGFKAECRYWWAHMDAWNGTARWRAPVATPLVFASDASTSGFAYGLESCSSEQLQRMPQGMRPGDVRSGSWSMSNGDAARQQHSAAIQWGEFFCPLAAAVEYGPLLQDSHVVFVIDNESDVFVINRLRSREPRVAALLRKLCDVALRHNFIFKAVHRSGVDNVLMDWASRPNYHRFVSSLSGPLGAPVGVGKGGNVGIGKYPPLLCPSSITHINSRCLNFNDSTSCASWARASGGW
jgi:hypothetical protein